MPRGRVTLCSQCRRYAAVKDGVCGVCRPWPGLVGGGELGDLRIALHVSVNAIAERLNMTPRQWCDLEDGAVEPTRAREIVFELRALAAEQAAPAQQASKAPVGAVSADLVLEGST